MIKISKCNLIPVILLVILGINHLGVSDAYAQRSPRDRYRPRITADDLKSFSKILNTTDEQNELIKPLYDGYQIAFSEGMNATKKAIADMLAEARKAEDRAAAYREIGPKRVELDAKWDEESQILEERFFEDVQMILTDDQISHWETYERDRRRRILLTRGGAKFAGESVDLFKIIEGMELSDEIMKELEPVMESYAEELDRILVERNDILQQLSTSSKPGYQRDTQDIERRYEIRRDLDEKKKDLRDLNNRYCDLIAQQLPTELGEKLNRIYLELCFASIYRKNQADRYIEKIETLENLTEEQVESINTIKEQYTTEADDIRRELVDLQKKREDAMTLVPPTRSTRGATRTPRQPSGGLDERQRQRWTELWTRLRKLESDTIERLYEELTEEQKLQAPKGRSGIPRDPMEYEMRNKPGFKDN